MSSFKGIKIYDENGKITYKEGLASDQFNAMIDLMSQDKPCTPMLDTSPSKAIWVNNSSRGLSTSLLNYSIQGSASSAGFLSCILVANEWLNRQYKLQGRFCVSAHDEYQFIYPKANALKAAYLQQIAHAWCWSLLHFKSDIFNVPISTLFASAVNIDKVWRKSAIASVKTPTSTNVFPGKELSIHQLASIDLI